MMESLIFAHAVLMELLAAQALEEGKLQKAINGLEMVLAEEFSMIYREGTWVHGYGVSFKRGWE